MKKFLYRCFSFFFSKTLYTFKKAIPGGVCSQHCLPPVPSRVLGLLGPQPRPGSGGGPAAAMAGLTLLGGGREPATLFLPYLPVTTPCPGAPTPWDSGRRDRWTEGAVPRTPPPYLRGCRAWICRTFPLQLAFLSCSVSLLN